MLLAVDINLHALSNTSLVRPALVSESVFSCVTITGRSYKKRICFKDTFGEIDGWYVF
jgi:hypothetical protein